MNKGKAITEIVIYSYQQIDKKLRQYAFSGCDREKQLEKCWSRKECLNNAIILSLWGFMAGQN